MSVFVFLTEIHGYTNCKSAKYREKSEEKGKI